MTEYILIVGLVAILCVGAVSRLAGSVGGSLRKQGDTIAKRVSAPVGKAAKSTAGGTVNSGGGDAGDMAGGDPVAPRPHGKPHP